MRLVSTALHQAVEPHEAIWDAPFFEGGVKLGITLGDGALRGIDFLPPNYPDRLPESELGHRIIDELLAYFTNPHFRFSIPLNPQGTPFQHRVWQALSAMQTGTTCSYGEFARPLGTAARAIGNACKANPIPIIVPCHRILASTGLGGYSGAVVGPSLAIKQRLLAHERAA